MNLQLIKKNIYNPTKRYIMAAPTKRDIVVILFREARRFIINYKVPLLVKIYWYGIFWATLFGGCYGCKKALSDENDDVNILNETLKKARLVGAIWMKLPFYMVENTCRHVKNSIE